MGATQYCGEPQSLNIVQARWACSEVVSWVKASGATIADAWKALKRYFLLPNGYKLPIEVRRLGRRQGCNNAPLQIGIALCVWRAHNAFCAQITTYECAPSFFMCYKKASLIAAVRHLPDGGLPSCVGLAMADACFAKILRGGRANNISL